MWKNIHGKDKDEVLISLEEMIDSIAHIQGREYADCVMVLYNMYTMGITLLYNTTVHLQQNGEYTEQIKQILFVTRKEGLISLGILFQTSATMLARNISALRQERKQAVVFCDEEKIKFAMLIDFKALARKMGLPNEII